MTILIKQLVMTRMMMVLKMKIWSFLFRGALCDRNPPFPSHDSPTDHCAQMLLIHCAQMPLIHCTGSAVRSVEDINIFIKKSESKGVSQIKCEVLI